MFSTAGVLYKNPTYQTSKFCWLALLESELRDNNGGKCRCVSNLYHSYYISLETLGGGAIFAKSKDASETDWVFRKGYLHHPQLIVVARKNCEARSSVINGC